MIVLGISCLYHDSAAALVVDGKIVAAVQEERFSRIKNDNSIPINSIRYCLRAGNVHENDIDYVVYYDNPALMLNRFLCNAVACKESIHEYLFSNYENIFHKRMWIEKLLKREFPRLFENTQAPLLTVKHHVSHAASAFFPSPFSDSIVITIDGVGEWTTTSIGIGHDNQIQLVEEIRYPHSLGLFYSAMAFYCGFKVNSEEYKFMGLSSYGNPAYYDIIKKEVIDIKEDGSFRLNLDYFDYQNGQSMINESALAQIFGGVKREFNGVITRREMDIAASVQKIVEEVVIKLAKHAKEKYGVGIDNLCLAGGVALNCVSNGKLKKEGVFKNIWIQPASGDAGGALGAALYVYYNYLRNRRFADGMHDSQEGSFLGPSYSKGFIIDYLKENHVEFHISSNIAKEVAQYLADGMIVGFFCDRLEYGPRALGHRSILADPRNETMQSVLNLKIKNRESFRPFAPVVLDEDKADYFEIDYDSPYMLICSYVVKDRRADFDISESLNRYNGDMLPIVNHVRSDIPAVTHVDFSARIQTVNKNNIKLYEVLTEFKKITGCSVLINTSFNSSEEPIVCSPEDAFKCFVNTRMDMLVLEDVVIRKDN